MIEHVKPTARIPAVQGQFGPRLVTYTTQLPPGSIETILGHDPRSKQWRRLPDDIANIYEHLQRATTKARLDSILRYIRYRFMERSIVLGAFPAISIAVQNSTPFEPFPGIVDSGVGVLQFDLSRRNLRIVVDGLGRASASMELVELSESDDLDPTVKEGLQNLLGQFSLPTVFYMPAPGKPQLALTEMQQLFHDFNFKVKAVPAREAIALDHSDLYIGLANRLGAADAIRRAGGMEMKAASLGKKSTAIVVQQNLLRFVRAATEGERFLESTANSDIKDPRLTEETLEGFEVSITDFLNAFIDSMGLPRFMERDGLHLTAPGWGSLGVLFHDLSVRLKVPDLKSAAAGIGHVNWSRSADMWKDIVRERMDKDGKPFLGLAAGGAQNRRFITQTIRRELGIDTLLREKGFSDEEEAALAAAADSGAPSDDALAAE